MRARLTAIVLALLVAATASAAGMQTVLAPDGTLYAIDGNSERDFLSLSRNKGDARETVLVPGTDDAALESDARLLWDTPSSTLFVVWHSAASTLDSVAMVALKADGTWSEPVVLASCASMRRTGLRTAITHAPIDEESAATATLVHVAWWGVGSELSAEYALVAFENGQLVSTDVSRLDDLAGRTNADGAADEFEDTGAALHPPLALTRDGIGVDVVYGAPNTTKMTRVRINPSRVKGDGRFWKPLGRDSGRTDPARLIADSTAPLQAFISRGRIVLYEPNQKFRFVVLENETWSPERMITISDHLTTEQLLDALRRTVDEQSATDGAKEQK